MMQTRWRPVVLGLMLALGLTVARAEDGPQSNSKAVPAPACCCDKPAAVVSPCCSEAHPAQTTCPNSSACPLSISVTACCQANSSAKPTTALVVQPRPNNEGPIEQCLDATCSFHFTNTPLRQVFEDLRSMSGVNIVADELALEEAGISLDRPVTLGLKNLSLKKGMDLLLQQMHLTYVIKDDVLQITTPSHAPGKLVTKLYTVAGLVQPTDRFGRVPASAREEFPGDPIIHVITSICPHTWSVLGGPGKIDYFPIGQGLAVTQTPEVHEQVAELLSALRRLREQEAVSTGPTCVLAGPGMVRVVAEPAPPSPIPTVLGAVSVAPNMPCVVHESAKPISLSWVVGVVVQEGQTQLAVQNGSDTRLVCKEMMLETLGGQLQLGTCDKQIQLQSLLFHGTADRLLRTEADDCVVLEGRVWLQCHEDVQHAEVFAERILVSLKDGHLEIRPAAKASDAD
jgi:hypothetical protein